MGGDSYTRHSEVSRMFKNLLIKAVTKSLSDSRIQTYKAPELSTPEFGAAHRQYGDRVYKTFAVMHVLDYLNFADEVSKYSDSSKWTTEERKEHLQKVVGKHRRRVR